MRIPHFVIISVAALVGVFAVGCSKSIPNPIVSFQGYKVGTDGSTQATFEFRNPGQSLIVCQVKIQPSDPGTENIISIPAGGSSTDTMYVKQTNSVSLSVTVMRLVPVHQFSVPMP
jgi:uncharacterized secreted protein with C-terminal beta-propeller domain